ncbi:MAG: hypothetical protein AB7D27_05090 [Desulfomicrobium sp.]
MASKPSLFMRILQAIIHRVWAVLFFLTLLSMLALANHWWDILASGYHALESWILAGIELIRG